MSALAFDPNLHYTDRGTGVLIVGLLECAIGTFLLVGRIYARTMVRDTIGADDWTVIVTWLLAVVTTIIVTLGVHYGIGHHVQYVILSGGLSKLTEALKYTWLTAPFSTMSACFGKISVPLLLMRLLNFGRRRTIFLWVVIVTLFLANVFLTVITFAQCTPASYLWDRLNPEIKGHCWNPSIQNNYGIFVGAYHAFTDIALAVVPIFTILKLKTSRSVKISVILLLSLGILAGAAAIVKTIDLPELENPDFTFVPVNLTYWYLTENWLIVIGGCVPTLRPLFTNMKLRWESSRRRNTSKVIQDANEFSHSDRSNGPINYLRSFSSNGKKPRTGETGLFTQTVDDVELEDVNCSSFEIKGKE